MTTTTQIIDAAAGVSMTVGHAYLVGGWRAWWDNVMNRPLGQILTSPTVGEDVPPWARGLFWFGAGLFALGLWRQWSGV